MLRRPDIREAFPRRRGHRAFLLFYEASNTAAGHFHPFISSQSSLSDCLLFAPTAICQLKKESWSCLMSLVSKLAPWCRGPSSHQKEILQGEQERVTRASPPRSPAALPSDGSLLPAVRVPFLRFPVPTFLLLQRFLCPELYPPLREQPSGRPSLAPCCLPSTSVGPGVEQLLSPCLRSALNEAAA